MRKKSLLLPIIVAGVLTGHSFQELTFASNNEQEIAWFKSKKGKKSDKKTDSLAKDSTDKAAVSYEKIVSKTTNTQEGLFKIHKNKNDYYFEVPAQLIGRDLLIINKLQKVPIELNEAGVNRGINYENQLIRFEYDKAQQKLMVRGVKPEPIYPENDAIAKSVRENFISPLIAGFKIDAFNKDSSAYVIKVNDLYNGTETSFNNVFNNINLGTSAIKNLSRIVSAKSFENNVVVQSELSTKVTEGNNSIFVTVEVSSSIVLLPETPMTGRFENPRVGYFTTPQLYFSDKQQKLENRELLTRWRLEPKEEEQEAYLKGELVEPKKPIIFYVDNTTPQQWRKHMLKGIEDWNIAFEKAGFKNAIIAKEMNDSIRLDADDVNYSVLTYVASAKVNAMGPSVYDPRSGEIIEADIIWWHNVMSMLQKWITVQTGTVNPAAQTTVLPDDLMGDAIRFVACHEVGHSLGLRHNMMGSWAFPTDSLRSKAFTDKMNSTSSSIMDYARYNYVTQPGDGVTALTPHIGPYDLFAVEFGYRWSGKKTPEEEKAFVREILSKYTGRLYKFSEAQDPRDAIDPRAQNEDLGDDPVKSSRLGIENLKKIMPQVVKWTTTGEEGQSYLEAGRLYFAVINQWNNYLYHVLANIGGMYLETTTVGDGAHSYAFVEKTKQQESLKFLLDEVLNNPEWLFNSSLNKLTYPMQSTPNGFVEQAPSLVLKNAQSYIFWDLLANTRLIRMIENEALNGKKAFTVVELMEQMHQHIFGITEQGGTPSVAQRSLQKGFVDALILAVSEEATNKSSKKLMDNHLLFDQEAAVCSHCQHEKMASEKAAAIRRINFSGTQATRTSDAISVKRGELLRIKDLLTKRISTSDTAARYHYKDILLRINTALGIK